MSVRTDWSKATTDIMIAMNSLMSAIEAGFQAWIEIRKNGDQKFPINIKNPELDNPFNWTMLFDTYKKPDCNENYFNETEKELTLNWTYVYGTEDAVEEYRKTGNVTEKLLNGKVFCPIRKKDIEKYYLKNGKEYFNPMTTKWVSNPSAPYYIPDETIESVFVICTESDPKEKFSKAELIKKAGEFLIAYAEMENKNE